MGSAPSKIDQIRLLRLAQRHDLLPELRSILVLARSMITLSRVGQLKNFLILITHTELSYFLSPLNILPKPVLPWRLALWESPVPSLNTSNLRLSKPTKLSYSGFALSSGTIFIQHHPCQIC